MVKQYPPPYRGQHIIWLANNIRLLLILDEVDTALANLALGDVASAIPLLREAADLSPPRSEGGIEDMSEQVNLGGALLEEGLVEDAMNLMNEIADEYCKDNEQDISSHGMSALCSILFNNLGIGHEMQSSVQGLSLIHI